MSLSGLLAFQLFVGFVIGAWARPWLDSVGARIRIAGIRRQNAKYAADAGKLKGRILVVGDLVIDEDGDAHLGYGWGFDCSNGTIPSRVDPKRGLLICGYTSEELKEIYHRQDEYVDRARE